MNIMDWIAAITLEKEVDCSESLVCTVEPEGSINNNTPSVLMCKIKIKLGLCNDDCNDECPRKS